MSGARRKVAIVCGPTWTPFSPDDLESGGLGGSETAAVRLAEHLAADLGYDVTVYGDVAEGRFGQVDYRNRDSFDATAPLTAVIGWRAPWLADDDVNAGVRLLWLHDADQGDDLTEERARGFDQVVCVSQWHRGHLAERYPFCEAKLRTVRNGIELDYFTGEAPIRANRLLYTSAPDRGLEILLELWPRIRARVPDAEFSYAYPSWMHGIAKTNLPLALVIDRVKALSDQDGVVVLGPLSQRTLATTMRSSLAWVHPSYSTWFNGVFQETSCIGAMEAQAAGCAVVASPSGALSETILVGRFIEGRPGSPAWGFSMVDEIVLALTDPQIQATAQREGPRVGATLGWEGVARQFDELIGDAPAHRPSTTVGLCMIVKNEAHVIKRCLDSVLPYIDAWTIVDTGSTDGTQDIVRAALADLPGQLHDRPWRDFGHNRTESLELARSLADYSLVIDADEAFEVPTGFGWPQLDSDSYSLRHVCGSSTFWADRLFSNRLPWRYAGVLHEYPECDDARRGERVEDVRVVGYYDGGRSQGMTGAEKYARDAETLERALEAEPDNTRYRFYLARSYRDSEQWTKAIAAFRARADMGGFEEEVFDSLLSIAMIYERTGASRHAVIAAFLEAFEQRPTRAEALCELARYLRQNERYALAHLFASYAETIPRPDDLLWVDDSVYAWRCRDEVASAGYWIGEREESLELYQELLEDELLPDSERERIKGNIALIEAVAAEAD
jgi:glycosyltransferase involved in cell wall biosynthesis